MKSSNPYERYLAKNVYEFGFKDPDQILATVLGGNVFPGDLGKKIYNDKNYGLSSPSLIYRWIVAM